VAAGAFAPGTRVQLVEGDIVSAGADPRLDQRILSLARHERPKICFVPTASGDSDNYIVRVYETFGVDRCVPSHLRLFRRKIQGPRTFLLDQVHNEGAAGRARLAVEFTRQPTSVDQCLAAGVETRGGISMRRVRAWLGMALVVIVAAVPLVFGLWQPAYGDPNDLVVGGVVWARITQSAGGYSAAQRIIYVRKRMTNIYSDTRFKAAKNLFVNAGTSGADAPISVGALSGGTTYLVVTVTSADAKANGTTVHQLASRWATNLSRGLNKEMPTSYFKETEQ